MFSSRSFPVLISTTSFVFDSFDWHVIHKTVGFALIQQELRLARDHSKLIRVLFLMSSVVNRPRPSLRMDDDQIQLFAVFVIFAIILPIVCCCAVIGIVVWAVIKCSRRNHQQYPYRGIPPAAVGVGATPSQYGVVPYVTQPTTFYLGYGGNQAQPYQPENWKEGTTTTSQVEWFN